MRYATIVPRMVRFFPGHLRRGKAAAPVRKDLGMDRAGIVPRNTEQQISRQA